MSYRAFKRLLGETSLERKCRFLFGAGTLLLITTIFWWYARRTEALAYEQTATTCRLLTYHILRQAHQRNLFDNKDRDLLLFGSYGDAQVAAIENDVAPFTRSAAC